MFTETMNAEPLFAPGVKPAPTAQTRPLGALSDFIVEELPERIAVIRAHAKHHFQYALGAPFGLSGDDGQGELSNTIERMISGRRFSIPGGQHDVARLDLMMVEAGLRAVGGVCGPALGNFIMDMAQQTGQKPILSYQDLILSNPQGDMRTFTNGAIGKQEADFYRGHVMIESCLWRRYRKAASLH